MSDIYEHRVTDQLGNVIVSAVVAEQTRWAPFGRDGTLYDDTSKYRIDTRLLPDGEWEPAALVRYSPMLPLVVIVRGTL